MSVIDEFLKTGQLGSIACGMSRKEVEDVLGRPEDISAKRTPEIWKYGSLQLVFHRPDAGSEPTLSSIALVCSPDGLKLPKPFPVDGWTLSRSTTYQQFRDYLAEHGIPIHGSVSGTQDHLVLASGVRVSFNEDSFLSSIGYVQHREPSTQQVTVPVDRTALDAIRREAAARKVSVSALCALWLQERAADLASR